MPMLYGEGEKAFLRLQEEITRTSDDQSLFAWTAKDASRSTYRGLFAKSPSEFTHCTHFVPVTASRTSIPFSLTSVGGEAHLQLLADPNQQPLVKERCIAVLRCVGLTDSQVGIFVNRISPESDQFIRVDVDKIVYIPRGLVSDSTTQKIYIRQTPLVSRNHFSHRILGVWVQRMTTRLEAALEVWPTHLWDSSKRLIVIPEGEMGNGGLVGALIFRQHPWSFTVAFGVLEDQQKYACALFKPDHLGHWLDIKEVGPSWSFADHVQSPHSVFSESTTSSSIRKASCIVGPNGVVYADVRSMVVNDLLVCSVEVRCMIS
jgi:hypothetical protein